ncbi:MAG: hypothetical protein QM296_04560, partial [Bacillota bacterium]|nr:hypothetical protein [Bacillota bacterium]
KKFVWVPVTGVWIQKFVHDGHIRGFGAPKRGRVRKTCPRLAQKGRLCPQIGAGTKNLSKGGQKMRWCPENRAGAEKLVHGWPKKGVCAPKSGQEQKNLTTPIYSTWRCSTAAFSFLFFHRKAAANELKGSSCAGDTCCAALK